VRRKKGSTLLELVVAMGIFTVISSLAIGAFVTVSRMKAMTTAIRESQQKLRLASENITRLSKQADVVTISGGGTDLQLFETNGDDPHGTRFKIEGNQLLYSRECASILTTPTVYCESDGNWEGTTNILSENLKIVSGNFEKTGANGLPELTVTLNGKYLDGPDSIFYRKDFEIKTSVILENLR